MKRPWVTPLLAFVTVTAALGAAPARPPDDTGTYEIYEQNRPVGTEEFTFAYRGDSVIVNSSTIRQIVGSDPPENLLKDVELWGTALDFDLRYYRSSQKMGDEVLTRGITLTADAFTVYREMSEKGVGKTLERPPGRVFVLDAESYALFDVICRNLHGRSFTQRPITAFVLGPRDTLIELTVAHLGADTLRWGGKRVRTRRLRLTDSFGNQVRMWVSPEGRMLRFEQPARALRVERTAPVRRARKPSG